MVVRLVAALAPETKTFRILQVKRNNTKWWTERKAGYIDSRAQFASISPTKQGLHFVMKEVTMPLCTAPPPRSQDDRALRQFPMLNMIAQSPYANKIATLPIPWRSLNSSSSTEKLLARSSFSLDHES